MKPPQTLRDKIAQLIFIRIGSNMPPLATVAEEHARVAALVERTPIGGLLLFNGGDATNCAETLHDLQQRAAVPLLIAADMERGSGQQITDHVLWPHSLAFDALGVDAAVEVERFAQLAAQQARSVGIHVSFSPVADIHRNPRNPIIATRAFATTAGRVAELATAYVRGCHAGGLLCCGKHFPGHGNTSTDSHAELPVVADSAEQLNETDLLPFHELVTAGVDMMMTAHVAYPALDNSGVPATLSRPILTDLLRGDWGYRGGIVSDSFKMEGVRVASETDVTINAVKAGVDLLLDITDVDSVVDAIERGCESDEQLAQRVEMAFGILWDMKLRAFEKPRAECEVDAAAAAQHAQMVARRALTVVTNNGQISTPVAKNSRVLAILINPYGDGAYTRTSTLVEAWDAQPSVIRTHVLTGEVSQADKKTILEAANQADCCLVAMVIKPAAWQDFGLTTGLQALVQQITERCATAIASLGVPAALDGYPRAAIGLTTYSDVPASQLALVEWFFG